MVRKSTWPILCILLFAGWSARAQGPVRFDFNQVNDRTWVGRDFWAVPLENWQIRNGRLESVGPGSNTYVTLLTHSLGSSGTLDFTARMGLMGRSFAGGAAGFRVGIRDETDSDVRSVVYFGSGLDAGVYTEGRLFLGDADTPLPEGFNLDEFALRLTAVPAANGFALTLSAADEGGLSATLRSTTADLSGLMALINNPGSNKVDPPHFWFDDLSLQGSIVESHQEHAFGPILWSMYTLSRGVLKMTAQLPPIGEGDARTVRLEVRGGAGWMTVSEARIDPDAYTGLFRIENWDASKDQPYRIVYDERMKNGGVRPQVYEGVIRRDPVDRPLVICGLTCQFHYGFPYRPLLDNLKRHDPDLLFFSGDQIYEQNGGYPIIRSPAAEATLNYLGKYYMFGWAFGDLMRDRPTVVIPDDHDVFQGNLWGSGGENVPEDVWAKAADSRAGYVQPVGMINVVHRTQGAHLPDPFDPEPIKQGITTYYTDLVYGRTSFAVVSDRMFKSGPEKVSTWEGRKDHLKHPVEPEKLSKPGLEFLGERQMTFLRHWMKDWKGADVKVLLSQTPFGNVATHHGPERMFLLADLDSGGWPKPPRDEAVDLLRRCFAFHVAGDQHIPTQVQYGLGAFRDAGWVFTTPAITVGYERRFMPDSLGIPVVHRPAHGLPNTGAYEDAFGNKTFVYAVGNPEEDTSFPDRYRQAESRASGYGIVRIDAKSRLITSEAYRFLGQQVLFPGWPFTVSQFDNYGRTPTAWLPEIRSAVEDPVVAVTNERTGELEYVVRIKGKTYRPGVFAPGLYTIEVSDPDAGLREVFTRVAAGADKDNTVLEVRLHE